MAGVTFTLPSAKRIAAAVREIEFGNRDQHATPQGRAWDTLPLPFRLKLGTFTGNWQTATYTTVTLHGSTQTASVYNWCNPAVGLATGDSSCTRYVIFGSIKGTQSAVEIQMRPTCQTCIQTFSSIDIASLPGYSPNEVQILGHNNSACLQWYSITTCSTATAA